MLFYIFLSAVIIQRLAELIISKRNEIWLKSRGAVEYGREHYKYIVIMHILFFVSMFTEYILNGSHDELNIFNYMFLVFFIILQVMRIWVISSLGKYWNTRIYRVHGDKLIKSGLYKYLKHPNYVIVCCEILSLPLIFNLFYTAVVFSVLNAIILSVRIRTENKILNYN